VIGGPVHEFTILEAIFLEDTQLESGSSVVHDGRISESSVVKDGRIPGAKKRIFGASSIIENFAGT
jgi:hypothetical protein